MWQETKIWTADPAQIAVEGQPGRWQLIVIGSWAAWWLTAMLNATSISHSESVGTLRVVRCDNGATTGDAVSTHKSKVPADEAEVKPESSIRLKLHHFWTAAN